MIQSCKPDIVLINTISFAAFDQALEFRKNRTVPSNWKTELKEETSSSEAEEEEEDKKENEDNSSEEEASIAVKFCEFILTQFLLGVR